MTRSIGTVAGVLLIAAATGADIAHAQSDTLRNAGWHHATAAGALRASAVRVTEHWVKRTAAHRVARADLTNQAPAKKCRTGRRAWIGALIGAGAMAPAAMLVHKRFENEAADGGAAAAWTVASGAAVGAFVGAATCS